MGGMGEAAAVRFGSEIRTLEGEHCHRPSGDDAESPGRTGVRKP